MCARSILKVQNVTPSCIPQNMSEPSYSPVSAVFSEMTVLFICWVIDALVRGWAVMGTDVSSLVPSSPVSVEPAGMNWVTKE